MFDKTPHLTEQDIHLTLAALRFMQAKLPQLPPDIEKIATNDGEFPTPSSGQIDELCEFLNLDMPGIAAFTHSNLPQPNS